MGLLPVTWDTKWALRKLRSKERHTRENGLSQLKAIVARHSENDAVKELILAARKDQNWHVQLAILDVLSVSLNYQPVNSLERALMALNRHDLAAVIAEGINGAELLCRRFVERVNGFEYTALKEDDNTSFIPEFERAMEAVSTLLEHYAGEISPDALRDIVSLRSDIEIGYGELIVQESYTWEAGSDYILGPGPVLEPERHWREKKTYYISKLTYIARSELIRRRSQQSASLADK